MNKATLAVVSAACVMLVLCQIVHGQPLQMSPSFHRISYTVGPDGRSRMGGHGDELEPFFRDWAAPVEASGVPLPACLALDAGSGPCSSVDEKCLQTHICYI